MGEYYYGGGKQEADNLIQISIFSLNKGGFLKTNKYGVLGWRDLDGSIIRVEVTSYLEEKTFEKVTLAYSWEGIKQTTQDIDLATTSCTLGGKRFWFICRCGRRIGVLYYYHNTFACRHCHDLTYETRNLSGAWKYAGNIISAPELDELKDEITRTHYAGKPTKRYIRYQKKVDKFWAILRRNLDVSENKYHLSDK